MSFAIGCWVRDTVMIENQRSSEYNKSFMSAISTAHTTLSTTIPGMHGHKTIQNKQQETIAKEFNDQYLSIIKG